MMLATLAGQIRTAEPGLAGASCPLCDGPVVAKCGEVNVWHWAHRTADCDPWAEPMSQWHLAWQELAPRERREVTIGNHRADIVTPRGVVVEIQRSHLSTAQIAEREEHYGCLVWVFDAARAVTEGRLVTSTPEHRSHPAYRTFVWKHAKRSLAACRKPVYLDLGDEVLLVGRFLANEGPLHGWGHIWTREQVAAEINGPFEEESA